MGNLNAAAEKAPNLAAIGVVGEINHMLQVLA